jgi:ABC-type transport system involved in multi-copper enzyme maturation permease subunit
LAALVISIGVGVLGCSLAFVLSIWVRRTHEALLGTYAVWLFWLLGARMLSLLGAATGVTFWIPPWTSDPFLLTLAAYRSPGMVGWPDVLLFLGVTLALSAALATLATLRVRAVCTRDRPQRAWRLHVPLPALPASLDRCVNAVSRAYGPSLDWNPVLWREWHRNRPSRWARAVVCVFGILAATFSAVAIVVGRDMDSAVNAFQVAVGLLMLSVTASSSLAEERSRGSLDVLMVTPMSTTQIVMGKWLGTFRLVPLLAILPTLLVTIRGGWNIGNSRVSVVMVAYVLVTGAAVTSLGLALATWCSRLSRAVGLTVMAYVVMTVGWMFLVMSMMGPHPYGFAVIAGSPLFGPVVITTLVPGGTGLEPNSELDFPGVMLWTVAYATVALVLLVGTLKSFDRLIGRITDTAYYPNVAPKTGSGAKPLATSATVEIA